MRLEHHLIDKEARQVGFTSQVSSWDRWRDSIYSDQFKAQSECAAVCAHRGKHVHAGILLCSYGCAHSGLGVLMQVCAL